jgi:hypothetical protein
MKPFILALITAAIVSLSDLVKQDDAISDGNQPVPYPSPTIRSFGALVACQRSLLV